MPYWRAVQVVTDRESETASEDGVLFTIPAGEEIESITIGNDTANDVTGGVNIGTTPGGSDIASAVAVAGGSVLRVPLLKRVLSRTTSTIVYISSVVSWSGAQVTVVLFKRRVF